MRELGHTGLAQTVLAQFEEGELTTDRIFIQIVIIVVSNTQRGVDADQIADLAVVGHQILHRIVVAVEVRNREQTIVVHTLIEFQTIPALAVVGRQVAARTQVVAEILRDVPRQVEAGAEDAVDGLVHIVVEPALHRRLVLVGEARVPVRHFERSIVQSRTRHGSRRTAPRITAGHHVVLADRAVEQQFEFHAPRQLGRKVGPQVALTQSGLLDRTLNILEVGRNIIGYLVRTAVDRYRVVLREGRRIDLLLPVAVLHEPVRRRISRIVFRLRAAEHVADLVTHLVEGILLDVAHTRIAVVGILRKVDHFEQVRRLGNGEGRRGPHARCTGLSALGGDQDDAVGTARTVDGRRGGILQHGDVDDVRGVELRERILLDLEVAADTRAGKFAGRRLRNVVDHIERLVVSAQRVRTTDRHRRCGSDGRRRRAHDQTGDLAFEQAVDRRQGNIPFRGLDVGQGSRDVPLAGRTVSHDDNLVERLRILLQLNVDQSLRAHGNLPGRISDKGKDQHRITPGDIELIFTVDVGRGTDRSPLDIDAYSGHTDAFIIGNGTAYTPLLRKNLAATCKNAECTEKNNFVNFLHG